MIVWLWDTTAAACEGRGVTDDETRAREAAEARMRSDQADSARVERALAVLGVETLTSGYERTGLGWAARRHHDGRITWVPFPSCSSELVAS